MKKEGFTLIELLAVIVVLAVIALIATPIILNVVEKSKEGAAKSSTLGYLEALEQYTVTSILQNKPQLQSSREYTIEELNEYEIDVKGEKPTEGTITLENNRIVSYELQVGEYVVKKDENGITTEKGELSGEYTSYAVGNQITIDGVSYHVIKKSSKYSDKITLLRDESIGEMNFDESYGTNYETSTLKTYLNTTYKETFGDKAQYISEITLLDFGYKENGMNFAAIPENTQFPEGTYMYLYTHNYEWFDTENMWTKTPSLDGLMVGAFTSISDNVLGYKVALFNSSSSSINSYMGASVVEDTKLPVRPVITINKEALN